MGCCSSRAELEVEEPNAQDFFAAIETDNTKEVERLVSAGLDPAILRHDGRTAIHVAAHLGHINCVRTLVQMQVASNVQDTTGNIALHVAAAGGHMEVIRYLANLSASQINQQNAFGWGPLHFAAIHGQRDCFGALVELGANINLRAKNGSTPLHIAAAGGYVDAAIDLLALGADVTATNMDGRTAAQYAAAKGQDYQHLEFADEGESKAKTKNMAAKIKSLDARAEKHKKEIRELKAAVRSLQVGRSS